MLPFSLYFIPFPDGMTDIKGATDYRESQGKYVVAINTNLPAEEQRATLRHELAHMCLQHFTDTEQQLRNITEIEAEADAYGAAMTAAEYSRLMEHATLKKGEIP